jgi:hypothetical protein
MRCDRIQAPNIKYLISNFPFKMIHRPLAMVHFLPSLDRSHSSRPPQGGRKIAWLLRISEIIRPHQNLSGSFHRGGRVSQSQIPSLRWKVHASQHRRLLWNPPCHAIPTHQIKRISSNGRRESAMVLLPYRRSSSAATTPMGRQARFVKAIPPSNTFPQTGTGFGNVLHPSVTNPLMKMRKATTEVQ